MKKHSFVLLSFYSLFFFSCEKNISLDLPEPEVKLVVEGFIESGSFPYLFLTKNSAYYSTFSLLEINNNFVHGAIVKVFDGTDTVTLQEFIIDTAGVQISVYYSVGMIGQTNKTYSLHIEAEGMVVDAFTTIPPFVPLDSIWVVYNEKQEFPDKVKLMCRLNDPPQLGQYVRYFTKANSQGFLPGLNSVFDDAIINGTIFDFPLDKGYNRNDSIDFDSYGFFDKGDTITVKWCNIDKAHFNFWRTLEFSVGGQGSPFASPIKIKSNIIGGLGIWGGYASTFKTIIVPQ